MQRIEFFHPLISISLTNEFTSSVEQVTTKKKANLILNVDGCIAVCFVDLLRSCGAFTHVEADEMVRSGVRYGYSI